MPESLSSDSARRRRARRRRDVRQTLGEPVDLGLGDAQGLSHVTHSRPGEEGVEGAYGRHMALAVALVNVIGHFVAAVGLEVDVDVGPLSPLQAQKSLEQQSTGDRVNVGEAQAYHRRVGCGAVRRIVSAPRAMPYVMNCKEVAFKAQSDDDVELVLEPVAHGLGDSPYWPRRPAWSGGARAMRGFACGRLVLGNSLRPRFRPGLHRSAMARVLTTASGTSEKLPHLGCGFQIVLRVYVPFGMDVVEGRQRSDACEHVVQLESDLCV